MNSSFNNFKTPPTGRKRGVSKIAVHDPASYSDAVHLPVSFLNLQPFGHRVAQIDHEPPDDLESPHIYPNGLAEDDALGHALGSVPLPVEEGLK